MIDQAAAAGSHSFFPKVDSGYTSDLRRRLSEHNEDKRKSSSVYRSWKVTIYIAFDTLQELSDHATTKTKEIYAHAAANKVVQWGFLKSYHKKSVAN